MPEISGMEVFPLREPVSRRAYTVVRVATRSAEAGYGECRMAQPADVAAARRILAGRDATAYEALRRELAEAPSVAGAVNSALLDLVGQAAKAPAFQVLGGPTRNRARAVARVTGDADAAGLRRAGFRAAIVPIPQPAARNQGKAFVSATRRRLETLRTAGGDDFDFVLDAFNSLTPGDASSIAAAFERFHLLWFDEPCPVSNLRAIRKISDECVTPLGFGRDVERAGQFQDLLREDAIDVLRPEVGRHGIAAMRRMAVIAETYYVAIAPRHDGGPVGTAAALQAAASMPNFFALDLPLPAADEDRRMREEIAGGSIETVRDGWLSLPTAAGLGIRVNPDALAKYRERAA
jgi:galactonate dehydratase